MLLNISKIIEIAAGKDTGETANYLNHYTVDKFPTLRLSGAQIKVWHVLLPVLALEQISSRNCGKSFSVTEWQALSCG